MTEKTFRQLYEATKNETEIHRVKLPVPTKDLETVFSEENIDLHYGVLYKKYVEKARAGEGGEFQVAGAKLHTIFFEQFKEPTDRNLPTDASKLLIDSKFGNFNKFRKSLIEQALTIHGSGWVYLDTKGNIKTIENHKIVPDVALLIDMWEHSYIRDYGADKERYINSFFKIVDWSIVNARINDDV